MDRRARLEQVSQYAEGTLPPDELRELENTLRSNPALRRDFLEYLNVDAALADCAALEDPAAIADEVGARARCGSGPTGSDQSRARRFMLSAITAATVLVAVSAVVWMFGIRQLPLTEPQHASITAKVLWTDRATWADLESPLAQGQALDASLIRLTSGSARLLFPSGVTLEILGRTEGEFEGPALLRLTQGRINVDVGERGKGFTVSSAAGDIVDLGTRFGVEVDEQGSASVAVFSGQVRVKERGAGRRDKPLAIHEGEGVTLRKGQRPRRLTTVALQRSEMALNESGRSRIVAGVTDNLTESSVRSFYGIVPGGMAEGTLVYTDKPRVAWHTADGAGMPAELLGADCVRTFHMDRHQFDLRIALELTEPAVVYVFHDARKPPLDWLAAEFTDTGLRVRSGPWNPVPVVAGVSAQADGQIYLEYTVWRKNLPDGGRVVLGPPHVRGEGGSKAMYAIAVQPMAVKGT